MNDPLIEVVLLLVSASAVGCADGAAQAVYVLPANALLYDTIGHWLVHLYGYEDKMAALKETYAKWGALLILVKGFTPIPFKLVTIVSGLLGYNFPLFMGLAVVTRGARFFVLAAALNHFGDPLRLALERHFAAFIVGMLALVVIGFYLAAHVL